MQKILILYPYFSPAEKAGGIVSSLVNLVYNLDHYHFYVYTSCYDLDGTQHTFECNQWIKKEENLSVYYSNSEDKNQLERYLNEIKPDKVYLNAIYGLKFFLKPLFKLSKYSGEIIIAPRGMLHTGALKVKPLKKKVYLQFLKFSGITKNVTWHATDQQEVIDIQKKFSNSKVILAQDTPPLKPNFANLTHKKEKNQLKLVFLSLITEKKNLLFLLEILDKNPHLKVQLDVIGPIKDHDYWLACKKLIDCNGDRINYKGQVSPKQVVETLVPYDFFILPTLGENFGHVIFEALTAGKPVITTHFTPWSKLEENQCGYNLELIEDHWIKTIENLTLMDNSNYQTWALSAQNYLNDYLKTYTPKEDYKPLFG